MIEIPAGQIVLRDEGTRRTWEVEVGGFRLASRPVSRELYRSIRGETPARPAGPRVDDLGLRLARSV